MIRNRTNRLAIGSLAVAASMIPGSLLADSSGFQLSLDPLVLEGLWLDQDTDSSKFQEYRDLSDGFRVQLGLSGMTADARRKLDFQVVNGGRNDAFYGLSYDVAGSWRLRLAYDNIPHNFGNHGKILWTRTNDLGSWELQDPIQAANQAALEAQFAIDPRGITFPFLDGLLQPYLAVANSIDIGLQRRRTSAVLDLGKGDRSSWKLEYRHEARNGLRNLGTSFGFNNVTELPEPISYDTTDAILSGAWRWDRGIATAGYRYSKFENDISTLYWDNPWRVTDATDPSAYSAPGSGSIGGSSRGQFDLAPDNDMGSFFANARIGVGATGWLQAAATWSRMSQDDPLLPMTINSAIGDVLQPYGSANREADMLDLALNYGVRFGDGWQAGARYVYRDYSDDSPRYEFDEGYVRFHAVLEEIPRVTVPFSWTRETLSASLDKDFGRWGNAGIEVKRDVYDRELRETEETTENLIALKWDGRVRRVQLRAKYELGNRDYSGDYLTEAQEYTFLEPEGINNQPTLRKYDQANRKIDRWNLSANLPVGEVWMVAAHVAGSKFDYDESQFGLTGDEVMRYGFDLSRDLGDGGSFFVYGERADRDVSMAARQSGATPSTNPLDDWFADFDEINDTLGVGWSKSTKEWQVKLAGEWVESDGEADLFSPPGGVPNVAVGFGNYEDYDRLSLRGDYDCELNAMLAVGVGVLYEDYSIDSFIRQDLRNYLPGALLIFADDGDYAAWSGSLRMTVRF
ncbi:MAG TPA: MtrB/PioB family outer membrane beta-barrel protein [Thermoanaerobaculia bacterium]|nr:MtrB/PioB family outer membrane beta-barrel protein [Thermoanaerobaculia bacterium]